MPDLLKLGEYRVLEGGGERGRRWCRVLQNVENDREEEEFVEGGFEGLWREVMRVQAVSSSVIACHRAGLDMVVRRKGVSKHQSYSFWC